MRPNGGPGRLRFGGCNHPAHSEIEDLLEALVSISLDDEGRDDADRDA
jgi:hypothetical protein